MKNKAVFIGIAVVVLISVGLWAGWNKYSDFLAQGSKPPEQHKILNKLDNEGVPDFSLTQVNGEPLSLKQFEGKIVLLNFWASWCEPCIKEFPSMISLIEQMKGEVVLLALSADYEKEDMLNFLKAFEVESEHIYVAWDKDQTVAKDYGTFTLPESYIIDKKGDLVRKISGIEEWDTPDAIEYFQILVNKKNTDLSEK